jgi:hypothetical protein
MGESSEEAHQQTWIIQTHERYSAMDRAAGHENHGS